MTTIDHTADIGLRIRAPDQAELLRRAALGLGWLLTGAEPPPATERRSVELEARDPPSLLRAWLREILHLWEDEDLLPADARLKVTGDRLSGSLTGGSPEVAAIREIKGVTLHRLEAERHPDGWHGHVIFDV